MQEWVQPTFVISMMMWSQVHGFPSYTIKECRNYVELPLQRKKGGWYIMIRTTNNLRREEATEELRPPETWDAEASCCMDHNRPCEELERYSREIEGKLSRLLTKMKSLQRLHWYGMPYAQKY